MSAPRIVVVGSLNMDLVVSASRMPLVGETIEGEAIHYIPGGKGANQAVGCGRLGADAAMIGAVGDDVFAGQLIAGLEDAGVAAVAVARLDRTATGTATILHTPEDNCIVIVPGANGRVTPETVESHRALIERADLLLAQLEIPLAAVERALSVARSAGVTTVLNPAPARALPDSLIRLADWMTPNETEFAALSGETIAVDDDAALERAMARWEAAHGNRLVVTLGSRGAAFLEDGRLRVVPAPKVKPVDTTGAGDCLNAAFGYGLASGWPPAKALAFGVRAASLSVTRFGAQAGMPTLAEVNEG
ncbi:ribokinase [Paenibacillus sp.]|uniref:ribokinase n=1 Tax=Paenibacillus sp. TaxID=58172 RepID=UPI002D6EB212|nr:ribokinase [Paenibacillus sp.]HZG57185.1 ribokinase [Paenibacillus sp.]